jgi:hypothetical protein
MSFWTDEQIRFLQQHLTHTSTDRYRLYVSRFGGTRTLDAVERQARRIKAAISAHDYIESTIHEDNEPDIPLALEQTTNPNAELLRDVLGRTARTLGAPARFQDREAFNEFVDRLIEQSSNIVFHDPPTVSAGSSFCILLSDTHIGKLTENFNRNVFVERLLSIPDKMIAEQLVPQDLEEIVLMLVGDMLEGEGIYETQAHHIEMAVIDQVQIAVDTIWKLACKLKAAFKRPVRIVTCPGNHGRVSKAAAEKSNWDNIVYQTLGFIVNNSTKSSYEGLNTSISINVNFEAFLVFPIQDKIGMIFHHGTKHLGTPAMQSKVAGWIHTKNFDFMCHGHWHHWDVGTQFGKLVMKNGSLPGDDDLSERMGVFDPPRQGWLIVREGQPINQVGFFEWGNV